MIRNSPLSKYNSGVVRLNRETDVGYHREEFLAADAEFAEQVARFQPLYDKHVKLPSEE
jgi:hypothetical protein